MNTKKRSFFSVRVDDKPGVLSEMLTNLRESNVDLDALWSWPEGGAKSRVAFVPKDMDAFRNAARQHNWTVEETPALMVTAEDRPGSLVDLFSKVAAEGVNLKSAEAMSAGSEFSCFFWADEAGTEKMAKMLGAS